METVTDRRCFLRQSASGVGMLALAVLSACSTGATPPPSQAMSRTLTDTAPADLQLLCADAAAKAGNTGSGKALPVTSRRLDATTYQVDLTVNGSTRSCIIDDAGNVVSVQAGTT